MLIIRRQYISGYGSEDPMQRAVKDFFQSGHSHPVKERMWTPRCDILETYDSLLVCVELPGVSEEDVQISYDGDSGIMLVCGHRPRPAEEERKRVLQMEMLSGPFEKFLKVNVSVDGNRISATLKNGILQIVLQKND